MHAFTPFYTPFALGLFVPIVIAAAVWTILLKGFSLWYAARGSQKWWFIALLVINTLGLLELVYLIWFRPDAKSSHHHDHAPHHHSSAAQ